METMLLGMLTLITLMISGCCLYYKKFLWSLFSGIGTMSLVCLAGYHWKLILVGSGKDTALLGFDRYPAALVILCILSFLAVASMIVSVILIARKRQNNE